LTINVTTGAGTAGYTNDFNAAVGFGTVTLAGDVVTYTPPPNVCGVDTFYYVVSDGQFGGSVVDQAMVDLCPLPDAIRLVNPTLVGGVFSASFATEAGVTYQVQYKNSLSDAGWTTVAVVSGDGTVKSFSDTGPLPAGMRFYHVIVP
jgi:hypothetical protein